MNDDPRGAKPAVVLLSGGLDSATTAAIAKVTGYRVHALTFDYGQRHKAELNAAKRVAEHLTITYHRWITIDLRAFGGSALTNHIDVPKDRTALTTHPAGADSLNGDDADVPVTYVPARNTIFLSYALAMAEVIGSHDLFLGVNAVDYSGYPDCRPAFISAFQHLANLATKAAAQGHRLTVHTPLIHWSKTQIIQKGLELDVDYGLTHSCYDPDTQGHPCRRCDACIIRQTAFERLGLTDPAWR